MVIVNLGVFCAYLQMFLLVLEERIKYFKVTFRKEEHFSIFFNFYIKLH